MSKSKDYGAILKNIASGVSPLDTIPSKFNLKELSGICSSSDLNFDCDVDYMNSSLIELAYEHTCLIGYVFVTLNRLILNKSGFLEFSMFAY